MLTFLKFIIRKLFNIIHLLYTISKILLNNLFKDNFYICSLNLLILFLPYEFIYKIQIYFIFLNIPALIKFIMHPNPLNFICLFNF